MHSFCDGDTIDGPGTCGLPQLHSGSCLPLPYAIDRIPQLTAPADQLPRLAEAPTVPERAILADLHTPLTPGECPVCWGGGKVGPQGEPWLLYESLAGDRTLSGWFLGPIDPLPCPACDGVGRIYPS